MNSYTDPEVGIVQRVRPDLFGMQVMMQWVA